MSMAIDLTGKMEGANGEGSHISGSYELRSGVLDADTLHDATLHCVGEWTSAQPRVIYSCVIGLMGVTIYC